ncbi:hypothetical protein [Marinobacter gelidimuriae]|uniref:hypothetical protein n=1 Tax=Marinobacter gelidimuriae TaxID=2739064 RepID=UPI0003757A2C|nr:hypothetical protein [Marinobacter gelidimuriae]
MKSELTIQLMDTHAGGDVSRIVTGGIDPLPGDHRHRNLGAAGIDELRRHHQTR